MDYYFGLEKNENIIFVDNNNKKTLNIIKYWVDKSKIIYLNTSDSLSNSHLVIENNKEIIDFSYTKLICLCLLNLNKKSDINFFIYKVLEFLKNEILKDELKLSSSSPQSSSSSSKNSLQNSLKLYIVLNDKSEIIEPTILLDFMDSIKCYNIFFFRINDEDDDYEKFLFLDFYLKKVDYDFINNFKNTFFANDIQNNGNINDHGDIFIDGDNNNNKNNNNHDDISINDNNKNNHDYNIDITMKFIEECFNKYHNISKLRIFGLAYYGNIFKKCKMSFRKKCNCNNFIDHYFIYYKIIIKLIDLYIKYPNNNINIYIDGISKKYTSIYIDIGRFLYNIKNNILDMSILENYIFVDYIGVIIDGINIIFDDSSSIKKDFLIFDNKKYLIPDFFDYLNKKNLEILKKEHHVDILTNSDCLNILLNIFNKKKILFKKISIKFGINLLTNKEILDANIIYKSFIDDFLIHQNEIKQLEINKDYTTNNYIEELCYSLYGKEIESIKFFMFRCKKEDFILLTNFVKESYIKFIDTGCLYIVDINFVDYRDYRDNLRISAHIPIESRNIPLKTINNVKSASKCQ